MSSNIIKLLLTTAILLLFAYPAFSYDLFNYIFDTRILIDHHQNPYTHTALDFPDDLWTRFMHWTHRPYPYGPIWLPLTIPFYLIGLNKFLITLFSYKLIAFLSYCLSCLAIYHITKKIQPQLVSSALIMYAFNPLIIIETLVSAHLDSAMSALLLLAIWAYVSHRPRFSLFWFICSIGIKYISIGTAPFFFMYKKTSTFSQAVSVSILFTSLIILLVIFVREILPWYFITLFSLTALIPENKLFTYLTLTVTPAALSRYIPYLLLGEYSQTVLLTREILFFGIIVIGFIFFTFFNRFAGRLHQKSN